ncbi:NUDIX hydrolase [Pseudomonas putida S11]|nr:NUDIX hydrolase [Pseudomonas putida S11]
MSARFARPSTTTNPNIVAGVLPTWGSQVLLCRRAIEPRRGFWTLPAGFMENGETLDQAARRETVEEACARVGSMSLYQLFDLPHINQVHVFFRAELADLDFAVGVESLEVRLFEEHEIPWGELAFRHRHSHTRMLLSRSHRAALPH